MPRAAVFCGANKLLKIKKYPLPPVPEGMARLDVIASPLSMLDVRIHINDVKSQFPRILGRQFIGKIREFSEKSDHSGFAIDDIVIADFSVPCQKCPACQNGNFAECYSPVDTSERLVFDEPFHGSFAEVAFAPISNMVKLPENVDPISASVFLGIGPSTISAFEIAGITSKTAADISLAVVQGVDAKGLFSIAYLASLGVKKIVAVADGGTKEYERLAISMGADIVLNLQRTSADAIKYHIDSMTSGVGADIVIISAPAQSAFSLGLRLARSSASLIVIAEKFDESVGSIELRTIVDKNLRIYSSNNYYTNTTEQFVNFLITSPRILEKSRLIIQKYSLSEINTAFHDCKVERSQRFVIVNE